MRAYSAREVEADQMEVRRSWAELTPQQIRQKIAEVRLHPIAKAQAVFGAMLAGALARHAPQHLALLPPEWLPVEAEGTTP